MNTSEITGPLLATRETAFTDFMLATTLALGIDLDVVPDREELRRRWHTASLRLVGTDMASRATVLGAVPGVWVIGFDSEELLQVSAGLGAPALLLPGESWRFAEVLSSRLPGQDAAQILVLIGASGGLGVSCLTVMLSTRATDTRLRSAAVELAGCGGGLDLLFRAEAQVGVTWEELRHAVGEIGDLTPRLVSAERVLVLALGRPHGDSPDEAVLSAVFRSLERSHDMVVVGLDDGARLAELGRRAVPLLMMSADVRSVAATRMRACRIGLTGALLAVRIGKGRGLPLEAVSGALGLPLAGVVRDDPRAPQLAVQEANVGSRPTARLRRGPTRLLKEIRL